MWVALHKLIYRATIYQTYLLLASENMSFQTVLIVGSTSGIGEELARQYHAKGKTVILSGRRNERLERIKSELPGSQSIQVSSL